MFFLFKKKDGNIKDDLLAGLTVSLAMVPEVVAFCFVAHVDPIIGLHATFIIAIITALLGGRPGMVSGAAGALAVVIVSLVSNHGIEFLFAAVVLAGILQLAAGIFRLGKFVRLIPHPVMLGFVNGLAIVIFLAQMGQFKSIDMEATQALLSKDPSASPVLTWLHGQEMMVMAGLVLLTMAIIQFLPKLTKAIPASLAAIITVTLLSIYVDFGVPVRTVFDQLKDMMPIGTPLDQIGLTGDLPKFHIPEVPFVWDSIKVILPYSIILCLVGLIESLMTLTLIDEITETRGNSNRECLAQGLGNLTNGFFGAMGGCAMIGQSMINLKAGGRGRLSAFVAGICILMIILFAAPFIEKIPLAALVGVMFMVVGATFEWASFKMVGKVPKADLFVIILVSAVTVFTDLAVAVITGVIVSALVFAWEHAKRIEIYSRKKDDKEQTYEIFGSLFFGSAQNFLEAFNPKESPNDVILDFGGARVCDHSGVEAIHSLTERFRSSGKTLHLRHLSQDCSQLLEKMGDLVEVNVKEDPHYQLAVDELG